MRLNRYQRQIIESSVTRRDPAAEVYLFGSRVDDTARGGDIDLLVVSQRLTLIDKLDILGELHRILGDRRIDLLLATDCSEAMASTAKENGVRL